MKLFITGAFVPDYPRNEVLIEAFKAASDFTSVKNFYGMKFSGLKILTALFKEGRKADIVVVMTPAERYWLPVLVFKILFRKSVWYDAFAPHYEGFVLDRKLAKPHSLKATYYYLLDYLMVRVCSAVFFDTKAHLEFFKNLLKIPPRKKLFVLPVSLNIPEVDRMLIDSSKTELKKDRFNVVFYGKYIPLQGIEYIVDAARHLLFNPKIHFTLIGSGQTREMINKRAEGLTNITFIPRVPYRELFSYMKEADTVLGIFGTTLKAELVVANKVLEALASRAVLITRQSEATKEHLTTGDAVLVSPGNGRAIAHAILEVAANPNSYLGMRESGRKKVEQYFSLASLIQTIKQNIIAR